MSEKKFAVLAFDYLKFFVGEEVVFYLEVSFRVF